MIVGTAGHVDHGKTALVQALTGVDTDRLKEEKARGITIDLGFAYLPLPGGGSLGFVDVPGHERLVRTMVAGAAGIDFALLVVAADDGIMPQTREHLEILGLLGLSRGLVALTKCDRVDAARRIAVADEVAAALSGTTLERSTIVQVSARTGEGIETLRARLAVEAATAGSKRGGGLFRLPVDRTFSLPGVGTIVTGTAMRGVVHIGDEVVVMPGERRARVRSIHAQNAQATMGAAGERLALNLAGLGIGRDTVARGSWVCAAESSAVTARFDADLHVLELHVLDPHVLDPHGLNRKAGGARPVRDGTPVHLHVGASDGLARVVLLQGTALAPGADGPAQIVLDAPLPLRHGDRFVLRDASARRTIGGGRVIDPDAPARRRRSPERLARLEALRISDPSDALARLLVLPPGLEDIGAFAAARGLARAETAGLIGRLDLETLEAGDATFVATPHGWADFRQRVPGLLAAFHADNPELPGFADERLRSMLGLAKPAFATLRKRLLDEGHIAARGHWLHLPSHVAELAAEDKRLAALVRPRIAAERFRPPRVRDIGKEIGIAEADVRRVCKALSRTGDLVEIAHDHFFDRTTISEMAIVARGLSDGFSAADFRDKLDNGRKVAIQILEYFDRQGLTRRDGDLRRVVRAPSLVFGA